MRSEGIVPRPFNAAAPKLEVLAAPRTGIIAHIVSGQQVRPDGGTRL